VPSRAGRARPGESGASGARSFMIWENFPRYARKTLPHTKSLPDHEPGIGMIARNAPRVGTGVPALPRAQAQPPVPGAPAPPAGPGYPGKPGYPKHVGQSVGCDLAKTLSLAAAPPTTAMCTSPLSGRHVRAWRTVSVLGSETRAAGELDYRPDSVHPLARAGGHPSRAAVADSLVRSTRGLGRAALQHPRRSGVARPS